ncbi:MAG: AI-2E family transporter, partial [Gammaproteobacteria bacterium]
GTSTPGVLEAGGIGGRARAARLRALARAWAPSAVVVLTLLAAFYTLYFAAGLFLPIFFAVFISIVLRPLVRMLALLGIHDAIGALCVLVLLIVALFGASSYLADPLERWIEQIPRVQRELETRLWQVRQSIEEAEAAAADLKELAPGNSARENGRAVAVHEGSLLNRLFESTLFSFVQMLIVLALAFFLLAQDPERRWHIYRRWSRGGVTLRAGYGLLQAVETTLTRYLRISAAIYLVLGVLTALVMALLQMPNPILWGGLATVLGFSPYLGPMILVTCIAAVSLLTFDDWWRILGPPLAYGALTIVEGYFVTPTILGRSLTVPPVAVFLSMLLWTWMWGVPGAFLAVPILVVTLVVYRRLMTSSDATGGGVVAVR